MKFQQALRVKVHQSIGLISLAVVAANGGCDMADRTDRFDCPLRGLIARVDAYATVMPALMNSLVYQVKNMESKIRDFLKKNASVVDCGSDGETVYRIEPGIYPEIIAIRKLKDSLHFTASILPRVFLIALVIEYDNYLAALIRRAFQIKPEILNALDRQIPFGRILDFASLEETKEYVIDEEIDAFLRMSHVEHFEWLEKKFGVQLREGMECWPKFVEVTERRNLFVHCNGIVSSQYLSVCRKHDVSLPDTCTVGSEVNVDPAYFREARLCILEVGARLTYQLWSKLAPEQQLEADGSLNEVCYDLICTEDFELAIRLLEYGTKRIRYPRFALNDIELMLMMNLAQCYKWMGQQEKLEDMLCQMDCSALSSKYRLAKAVLLDEFDEAANEMVSIGSSEKACKIAYKEWPLFREFRKSAEFADAYERVFGHPFDIIDSKGELAG